MMPSMSSGSRPASASARSTADAAMSVVVRPDALVCSDSPTPTIATCPDTSSSSVANPQPPEGLIGRQHGTSRNSCVVNDVWLCSSLRRYVMPAVTVDNVLALPRVAEPDPVTNRPVISVTTAPRGFEGEAFPVRRAFAGVDQRALDPFVHMDQMGEVLYAPGEPKGTAWHPHRGFETVTYMIDGTFQHRDSTGGGGLITNGATQWMTAGAGILHIEKPPEALVASGGLFHGIQLWVNLPSGQKWTPPRYQDIGASRVTLLASHDGGALVRVIAGEIAGHKGPGITHTPISLLH